VNRQERRGGRVHRRHFLEHQCGVQARQTQAADVFAGVDRAKAHLARPGEGFAGEDALGIPARGVGSQLALCVIARGLRERALLVGQFQVHSLSPDVVGIVSWRCCRLVNASSSILT